MLNHFKILLLIILSSFLSYANNDIIESQAVKFKEILKKVDESYVDSVDLIKISDAAFKAMLQDLDKQSYYFNQDEYLRIKNKQSGTSAVGIGVEFSIINDTLTVKSTIKNSPADSIGLKIGDIILFVDGKSLIGKSVKEAKEILNGEKNSTANIIYKDFPNRNLKEINIERTKTPVSDVKASFIINGSKIGYIRCGNFSKHASDDVLEALQDLKKQGMESLVFDLRDNGGGILKEGISVCGLFLDSNKLVTKTLGKDTKLQTEMFSNSSSEFLDLPLVVLINEKSASVSEIFSGAVQDYDRGLVIGEISKGKGTVQKSWEFKDSTAFRITISRWVTPSGRPVELSDKEKVELDPLMMSGMDENVRKELEEKLSIFGTKQETIYKTESGRNMYAVGGILPDLIQDSDSLSLLTRRMIARDFFLEVALRWVMSNPDEDYGKDYDDFYKNYKVTEDCLTILAEIFKRENTFNQEMYNNDKLIIINKIKAHIALLVWGEIAYHYVDLQYDKQLISGLRLLPEAKALLNN